MTNNKLTLEDKKLLRLTDFFIEHFDVYHTKKQLLSKLSYGGLKYNEADIRKYTKKLRTIGYSIVADNNGYKFSRNREDVKNSVKRIRKSAQETLVTAKDLEKTIDETIDKDIFLEFKDVKVNDIVYHKELGILEKISGDEANIVIPKRGVEDRIANLDGDTEVKFLNPLVVSGVEEVVRIFN